MKRRDFIRIGLTACDMGVSYFLPRLVGTSVASELMLTGRFIDYMEQDADALGVLRPNAEPRATAHMGEIIAMIEALVERGYAYAADNGDVYYSVAAFDGYGNRTLDLLGRANNIVGIIIAHKMINPPIVGVPFFWI